MRSRVSELLEPQVGLGQLLSVLQLFHFRGSSRIDILLLHHDRLYVRLNQQVGDGALHPGVGSVFTADASVPLERTWRLGEHFLKRPAGTVAIFGMYQFEAVPAQELLRF